MSSCLSISVHDFLIANVVSYKVAAASDDFNRFHLSFKDIWGSKVHIANHRSKLDSHLDQLGLFRMCLGRENKTIFKFDVILNIFSENVRLIQL